MQQKIITSPILEKSFTGLCYTGVKSLRELDISRWCGLCNNYYTFFLNSDVIK